MTTIEITVWIVAIALTFASVAAAIVAGRPDRRRLVAASAIPIIGVLIASAVGVTPVVEPTIAILMATALTGIGVIGGAPAVTLLLATATKGAVRPGAHGGILVRDASAPLPEREILRGGITIGYLERFALIGAVLVGQPAAIAIIVAVKGLGRFSELDNEHARERFIIGTLASLTWASVCAVAVSLVTGV
ncbi:hypothetical protein [Marisediminicola sp. LYQ134]|uniref:hypothetical protein n=1 Tax=unclassified Marisediminicola TaxID=2618316 RepID=UPI003983BB77